MSKAPYNTSILDPAFGTWPGSNSSLSYGSSMQSDLITRVKVLEKEIDQLNMENTLLRSTSMNLKPSEIQ